MSEIHNLLRGEKGEKKKKKKRLTTRNIFDHKEPGATHNTAMVLTLRKVSLTP